MTNSKENKNTKTANRSEDFKFEIINHIGVISQNSNSGWTKELNIVKWNSANPKIDIREWDETHERMSRGASLSIDEAQNLRDLLEEIDFTAMV